jgi:hypothetical protein
LLANFQICQLSWFKVREVELLVFPPVFIGIMWRLALLAVVVSDVSAVRPMGEQHSKNRPSQYQRCRLKTEMGIGDCLELDRAFKNK